MQCLADSCVFRLVERGKVAMHLVVLVDVIFAVGKKERVISLVRIWDVSFQSSRWRAQMVLGVLLRERQGGREVDYFATDVHGRIGREVWRGMGQRYSDSYSLEALGF